MMYSDQRHIDNAFVNMAFVYLFVFFSLLASSLISASVSAREPAPVIEGTSTPLSRSQAKSIEDRLTLIERKLDNQALIEVMNRLDGLQQEMQRMIGDMEVQTHDISSMKKRQRDLYADIDRRLRETEQLIKELQTQQKTLQEKLAKAPPTAAPAASTIPGSPTSGTSVTPSVSTSSFSDAQLERQAYQRAFNLLKDNRYELAIASFKAFLETYPDSNDADYAQYWLGDTNYVQERYDAALTEFQRVLDKYPKSKKIPDTLLRMGFTFEMKGETEKAKQYLNRVIKEYPSSTAAHLASNRLRDLKKSSR